MGIQKMSNYYGNKTNEVIQMSEKKNVNIVIKT